MLSASCSDAALANAPGLLVVSPMTECGPIIRHDGQCGPKNYRSNYFNTPRKEAQFCVTL